MCPFCVAHGKKETSAISFLDHQDRRRISEWTYYILTWIGWMCVGSQWCRRRCLHHSSCERATLFAYVGYMQCSWLISFGRPLRLLSKYTVLRRESEWLCEWHFLCSTVKSEECKVQRNICIEQIFCIYIDSLKVWIWSNDGHIILIKNRIFKLFFCTFLSVFCATTYDIILR